MVSIVLTASTEALFILDTDYPSKTDSPCSKSMIRLIRRINSDGLLFVQNERGPFFHI